VTVLRGLFLLLLGAGLGLAADRVLIERQGTSGGVPPAERTEPGAGDPPLVWLDGTLEELGESQLGLRAGEGDLVRLQRLAEGATAFLRPEAEGWVELLPSEVDLLEPGVNRACVEALLDGRTLLALRVFLGAECGPSGPA